MQSDSHQTPSAQPLVRSRFSHLAALSLLVVLLAACELIGPKNSDVVLDVTTDSTSAGLTINLAMANNTGMTIRGGGICEPVYVEELVDGTWTNEMEIAPLAVCVALQEVSPYSSLDWSIDFSLQPGVYRFAVDMQIGQVTQRITSRSTTV